MNKASVQCAICCHIFPMLMFSCKSCDYFSDNMPASVQQATQLPANPPRRECHPGLCGEEHGGRVQVAEEWEASRAVPWQVFPGIRGGSWGLQPLHSQG